MAYYSTVSSVTVCPVYNAKNQKRRIAIQYTCAVLTIVIMADKSMPVNSTALEPKRPALVDVNSPARSQHSKSPRSVSASPRLATIKEVEEECNCRWSPACHHDDPCNCDEDEHDENRANYLKLEDRVPEVVAKKMEKTNLQGAALPVFKRGTSTPSRFHVKIM